jgi:hypothetical protein
MMMRTACFLGFTYFAAVFAFAFAMGVARTLVITPLLGATAAVLLELPLVLALSWFVARTLLRNRTFMLTQRAAMGATAFALTMLSEMALSYLLRGQGLGDWVASLITPLGLLGLSGQVAFSVIPVLAGFKQPDSSPGA